MERLVNRRTVGWALVVVAVLCLAWSGLVVLTPFAGEFWGLTLIVGVAAGISAWRVLRTGPR
jgi:hypothetical protein